MRTPLRRRIEGWRGLPSGGLASGFGGALAVVLLSTVAWWPLTSEGRILTGDTLHPVRLYEMHRCLDDGQIPCRWVPDLGNGYGFPLFNYYPPLPYYVGDLIHRLGLSYLRTVDVLYVVGLIGAGLSMFLLARRVWGDLGGLVSAVAYTYAPYLALDVYMRGALAELWGFALAPALLWAITELPTTGRRVFVPVVALLLALLLLSHNLVAVIVAPAVALWALVLLVQRGREAWQPALLGATAGLWGLGLAAFFTLPVLFEGDLVQLDSLSRGVFHYSRHFASVRDLFLLRDDDYSFLLRVRLDTPVQIGWFHWVLAGLSLPAGAVLLRGGRPLAALAVLLFAVSFGIGVFMAVSRSRFVWDAFDALRFLQFPWRYLGLVSLASAGLAGAWFAVLARPARLRTMLACALIALFIVSGRDFLRPFYREPLSDEDILVGERFAAARAAAIRDYLPAGVAVIPPGPPAAPARVLEGRARLLGSSSGSDWLRFDIEAGTPARLEAAVFDFPDWRVRVDGQAVPHATARPSGLIALDVAPGRHAVELRLEDTAVRRAGNLISLASWSLLAFSPLAALAVGGLSRARRNAVAPARPAPGSPG